MFLTVSIHGSIVWWSGINWNRSWLRWFFLFLPAPSLATAFPAMEMTVVVEFVVVATCYIVFFIISIHGNIVRFWHELEHELIEMIFSVSVSPFTCRCIALVVLACLVVFFIIIGALRYLSALVSCENIVIVWPNKRILEEATVAASASGDVVVTYLRAKGCLGGGFIIF